MAQLDDGHDVQQASYLLRTAPEPVGIVAQTRHDLARELIDELTLPVSQALPAAAFNSSSSAS